MLKFLRLIVAFLVASLIAGFLAWASVVHRNLAGAEKALASGRLEVAEEAYESVSEDIKNVRILFPVISDEIVSRQAAISYWKGEYEKNVRNISSGRELVDDVNFGQALAAVNSVVRIGAEKGDIKSVLDSLDRAISSL